MSKISVIYDSSQEIEQIVKEVEQHIDMKKDENLDALSESIQIAKDILQKVKK